MSRKEGGKELKEGRKDKMNRREERRKKLKRKKEGMEGSKPLVCPRSKRGTSST